MKVDLAGKIKSTHLPTSKALLPMFEAVVNSFQAIEDGVGGSSSNIEIIVDREAALEGMETEGDVRGFVIIDNGVGFGETNLNSFFTEYTMYKVSKGGKGVGRFMWLKAFQYAEIESHYLDGFKMRRRAFRFTTSGEEPSEPPTDSNENAPKTTVRLVGLRHLRRTALAGLG